MNAKLHTVLDWVCLNARHLGGVLIWLFPFYLRYRLRRSAIQAFQVQENLTKEGIKMEKAYDLKGLVEKLKSSGLEMAEEEAKIVIKDVCEWLDESGKLSATPYDDMAFAVALPKVKELALGLADKINPAD